MRNYATNGEFREAAERCDRLYRIPPKYLYMPWVAQEESGFKDFEAEMRQWHTAGLAEDADKKRLRMAIERLLNGPVAAGAAMKARAIAAGNPPVQGFEAGYLAIRKPRERGFVVMPTTEGFLLEIRRLPAVVNRWPSRSIREPSPERMVEAADSIHFTLVRTPSVRLVGFLAGNWAYSYPPINAAPTYQGNGRYLQIPYWFLLTITSILPFRALARWARKLYRRQRGLCMSCGYDLRELTDRCPECGVLVRRRLGAFTVTEIADGDSKPASC